MKFTIYKVPAPTMIGWVYTENPKLIRLARDTKEVEYSQAPQHIKEMFDNYKAGLWISDLERNLV